MSAHLLAAGARFLVQRSKEQHLTWSEYRREFDPERRLHTIDRVRCVCWCRWVGPWRTGLRKFSDARKDGHQHRRNTGVSL